MEIDLTRCYWCLERFRYEKGTKPEDGMYLDEVGEWWSESLQDSVLGHPDCLPMGVDATLQGLDPNWCMA